MREAWLTVDDRALIEGLLAQTPSAWGEFDRAIKVRLMHMFARKGVVPQDRLDCYHDFCVRLIERDGRRLRQWRGDSTLLTWLLSAARNHAVDWVRQVQQHRAQHVEHDEAVEPQFDPALAPAPVDPETAVATTTLVVQLRRAIDTLPTQEQRVARLLFVDGLSPSEIAELIGITPNNVYQISHRAQKKLGDLLNPGAGRTRDGART